MANKGSILRGKEINMNKNLTNQQRQQDFNELIARMPRDHDPTKADIEILETIRLAQEQRIAESIGAQAVEAVGSGEAE